jgi:hypothetical protein
MFRTFRDRTSNRKDKQLRAFNVVERTALQCRSRCLGNLRSEARDTAHVNTIETAFSAASGSNPTLTALR